jgi:glycosyltransferase involved in cell wall biosynthesis
MYKVSVIVPIYNVSAYIDRCARSLLDQTLDSVQFIFVDDATPDNSIDILYRVIEDYPKRKKDVMILHNEVNKGLAATRFVGFDKAEGEYIYHCDSDDWVEVNMLEVMYAAAKMQNADIVCCEGLKEAPNGRFPYRYAYDEETLENGLLAQRMSEIYTAIWNKVIKRSLYTQHHIRNYEGINMNEDTALTARLRYFSQKTIILHQTFYHYNRMNLGAMTVKVKESSVLEQIKLAARLEKFFKTEGEEKRFVHLVNWLKFNSKQAYARSLKDLDKWFAIYPECHKDILRFKSLTLKGRIKWWMLANLYPLKLLICKR